MLGPGPQLLLAPVPEAYQCDVGIGADLYLVCVGPDLQTHQHHTDTQATIHLQTIEAHFRASTEESSVHVKEFGS